MQNTAFVLGNGVSRSGFTIPQLKKYGPVYGCNAIYRTDVLDYLVAVDQRMVLEITKSGYHRTNQVWTNARKGMTRTEHLNFFKPSKGWSSGPTALWLASSHEYTTIYILGFDYKGIDSGTKVNNLYAGTENYKKKDATATYFGNWLRQTCTVIKDNPNIQYIRVIQSDNYCPTQLNNFTNFKTITVDEFDKFLC
jgi:hypothetical protein